MMACSKGKASCIFFILVQLMLLPDLSSFVVVGPPGTKTQPRLSHCSFLVFGATTSENAAHDGDVDSIVLQVVEDSLKMAEKVALNHRKKSRKRQKEGIAFTETSSLQSSITWLYEQNELHYAAKVFHSCAVSHILKPWLDQGRKSRVNSQDLLLLDLHGMTQGTAAVAVLYSLIIYVNNFIPGYHCTGFEQNIERKSVRERKKTTRLAKRTEVYGIENPEDGLTIVTGKGIHSLLYNKQPPVLKNATRYLLESTIVPPLQVQEYDMNQGALVVQRQHIINWLEKVSSRSITNTTVDGGMQKQQGANDTTSLSSLETAGGNNLKSPLQFPAQRMANFDERVVQKEKVVEICLMKKEERIFACLKACH